MHTCRLADDDVNLTIEVPRGLGLGKSHVAFRVKREAEPFKVDGLMIVDNNYIGMQSGRSYLFEDGEVAKAEFYRGHIGFAGGRDPDAIVGLVCGVLAGYDPASPWILKADGFRFDGVLL